MKSNIMEYVHFLTIIKGELCHEAQEVTKCTNTLMGQLKSSFHEMKLNEFGFQQTHHCTKNFSAKNELSLSIRNQLTSNNSFCAFFDSQ